MDLGAIDPTSTPKGQQFKGEFKAMLDAVQPYFNAQLMTASSFAFWSTDVGKARALGGADVMLESSAVGFLFDGINITGDWDTQLWAMLSNAYSEGIVRKLGQKELKVFVGPGARADNVFAKIELPVLKQQVESGALPMTSYACAPQVTAAGGIVTEDTKSFDPGEKGGGLEGTYAAKGEGNQGRIDMIAKANMDWGRRKAAKEREAEQQRAAATTGAGGSAPASGAASPTPGAPPPAGG